MVIFPNADIIWDVCELVAVSVLKLLPLPFFHGICLLQAYNGNTALHVAASLQYRVSQLDAVRLLMRKGADPSARNLENEQPVHLVPDGLVGEQVNKKKPTQPTKITRTKKKQTLLSHPLPTNPKAIFLSTFFRF